MQRKIASHAFTQGTFRSEIISEQDLNNNSSDNSIISEINESNVGDLFLD